MGLLTTVAVAVVALGLICFQSIALGSSQEVPTGASVQGTNVAPNIECKWELPDMQSGVSAGQYPDNTIQYGTASDAHQHDDDMGVGPGYPCSGTPPSMPDGVHNMIQVLPNPEDSPEEVWVQLWAAVDHEQGLAAIDDVYWVVWHPDGTPKVQVHGTKIPNTSEGCGMLGSSTATGTMFEAAYHTGQVAAESIDDINGGMVAKCQEAEKAIYYAKFNISKHQPCGEYKIDLHAVSGGVEDVLTNYIDVLCFYYMEIDFTTVDWGLIKPGITKVVSGDLLFNPSSTPVAPTIKNTGNSGMGVGIHFSQMLQQGVDPIVAKKITQFDACFGKSPATIQCIDPIPASTTVWFDDDPQRVLCSNEVGKLDLSIHPPSTLPNGTYAGTVDVYAKSVKICPTDQEDLSPTGGGS
jgi:urease beta subunit